MQSIRKLIGNSKVRDLDAVRLVMLYALRYEKHSSNDVIGLIDDLKKRKINEKLLRSVLNIVEFGGTHAHNSGLLGAQDAVQKTKRLLKVKLLKSRKFQNGCNFQRL